MKTWYSIVAKSDDIAEVMIYDQIGGWGISANQFVQSLSGIKAKQIVVRLNSPGGEVFDGFAIYNALKSHPAKVRIQIDGLAASIASVIAMAGDEVCIAKNAWIMIHNALVMVYGNAQELRKQAELLDKLSLNVAQTYVDKCGKPLEELQKCMNEETWFDASEAKSFGLVDSINEDDDEEYENRLASAGAFKALLKFERVPEKLKRIAASIADRTLHKESHMAFKPYNRDGKTFIKVNDVEHEIEAASAPAVVAAPVVATAATAPVNAEEIRTQAVAAERQYAKDFNTAVATAGITGKAAEQFSNEFYGRPIGDVKFLASHAIGARTQAVGEGGGAEGVAEQSPEAKIEAAATKRFAEDRNVRKLFNVSTTDASNPIYKSALARYVAREQQAAKDGMNAMTNEQLDAKYGARRR